MKKLFLFTFLFSMVSLFSFAQQNPMEQTLPVDPAIRMGTLKNGLKYYIFKNENPKGLANFYILHNIGALEEEDHQNGLAHFLEHMAFNGTTHLPGKMLLDYLQANDVEFGRDINAMTGQDNTQYMLKNIPTTRSEGLIDTAIITLGDWASGIALKHAEIDAERGVIIEEKRTNENSGRRLMKQYFPVLFNHSKYAERDVIGTDEVLKNFKYSDIKDFYNKWYNTDQQAVVIVGDIDVDAIEAKINSILGVIPAPKVPTPKVYYPVPAYTEDVTFIAKDKEHTSSNAMILKHVNISPKEDNNKFISIMKGTAVSILTSVLNERLSDISRTPNAPFLGAQIYNVPLGAVTEAVSLDVSSTEGQLPTAIKAVTTELNRFLKYGVNDDEVERVKMNFLEYFQNQYNNRATIKSETIANMLIANYFENKPMLTPEMDYQIHTELLNQVNAQILNQFIPMLFPAENKTAIVALVPDKEGAIPTEESLYNAYKEGLNAQVEALAVEKIDRPLIEKEPKAVKVRKTSKDELGNTVWTFKNGAKVVVKPTDYRQDEILFYGIGDGGKNMFADDEMVGASILPNMLSMSGLGTFTIQDLGKVLAGKNVSTKKSISGYTHGISGRSSIKDLETAMKLLYLSYTEQQLRQEELDMMNKMLESQLPNMESQADYIYSNKLNDLLYNGNPRVEQLSMSNYKNTNLAQLKELNDRLFDGVNGMTFIFVGSINEEALKPLVEKYIGSLPKGGKKHAKPTSIELVKGDVNETIAVPLETAKVTPTFILHTDDIKEVNIKNSTTISLLKAILEIKYTKSIREEMGATYGVGVSGSADRNPKSRYTIYVQYDTNEKQADETAEEVMREINAIASGEASITEELNISKGIMGKNFTKSIDSSNQAWVNYISALHRYDENRPKDFMNILNSISEKDIQEMANQIVKSGNKIIVKKVQSK